ncbi:MAG: TonB-dependent receptor domain-containing protein, partial [Bryobacteraceae bacterium]
TIQFQNTGISPGWGPATFIQNNYNWRNVLSWVKGAHTLKFGFQAFYGDDDARFNGVNGRPTFQFNNLLDLVRDDPFSQSGPAYDPLTGQPGMGGYRHLLNTFGAFIQDDWKVRPNLTLTLGIRWDDYGNPYADLEKTPTFGNIILGPGGTLQEQIASASVRSVEGAYDGRLNKNFSPRLGFAWDPTGEGKWAIRGGAGLYNDWIPLGQANTIRGNPPGVIYPRFVRGQTEVQPIFSIGTQNTFPFGFTLPQLPAQELDERGGVVGAQVSAGGIDRNIKSPKTFIWNTGVERQLPGRWVLGAMYSGSRTWDSVIGTDMNRFAGDLLDGSLDRLNPSFGAMTYIFNRNEIDYHAAIFTARSTLSARSQIQASYTLSQTKDLGQGGSRVNRDGGFNFPEPTNFENYRSFADWDARHRFSLAGYYQFPDPGNAVLKHIFGGWQISSVTILQSGLPFQVVNRGPWNPIEDAEGRVTGFRPGSGDYNADGFNYDYPNAPSQDFTGSHDRQEYIRGLFTAADFPTPEPGTPGNLQRHIYRGPGLINVDAG